MFKYGGETDAIKDFLQVLKEGLENLEVISKDLLFYSSNLDLGLYNLSRSTF